MARRHTLAVDGLQPSSDFLASLKKLDKLSENGGAKEQVAEKKKLAEEDPKFGLDNIVKRCWTDDAFKDVTLESKDGQKIKATRIVMAARSAQFEMKLLHSEPEVYVDLEGEVLKAIVEYCFTDDPSLLKYSKAAKDDKFIPTLFRLQKAASDWELPGLLNKIGDTVVSYLKEFPSVCFGAYEAWTHLDEEQASKELGDILLDQIRSTPMAKLDVKSVETLSEGLTKQILSDEKMQVTELDLFLFLQMWSTAMPGRKNIAMDLIDQHIKLQDIAPTELSTTIASSGLVTPDQLMDAYKEQALAAQSGQPTKFDKKRFSVAPVWRLTMADLSSPLKGTQNWKADVLDVPPLKEGKHEWTVEIVQVEEGEMMYSWLGIASSKVKLNPKKPLDGQDGCWAVSDRSRGVHDGATIFAEFDELGEGSKLTFILDLEEDEDGENGTLVVKVETGSGAIKMLPKFTNLLEYLEENEGAGFVPAMSIRECCVVRALGNPMPCA